MMAKKKTIQDPVLGKLVFDVLWEGNVDISPFGEVELTVVGGDKGEPPTEAQQNAVADLQRTMPKLATKIYQAIFDHYQENREDYLADAIDPEEEVPELASAKEIERVLDGPPTLSVDDHLPGESPSLKLHWGATFDDEHGIEVELVDGEIRYIGRP